jgi:2,3-bisphosphoglycerate-independent phosphoglycerate mutase
MNKKAILVVMDGWGIAPDGPGNAITQANPKTFNHLWKHSPHVAIEASGVHVGLMAGNDGDSETGHLNLGAGRVVNRDVVAINQTISDGSFYTNPALHKLVRHLETYHSRLHIMGLAGSSFVHASVDHLRALIKFVTKQHIDDRTFLHLFTDGRDSPPTEALELIPKLEKEFTKTSQVKVVSICGRYYAMDRDLRWPRTQKTFDCLTGKSHRGFHTSAECIQDAYDSKTTDEFILPSFIGSDHADTRIRAGDAVIFFNYRTDRPRQLTELFLKSNISNLHYLSMTQYRDDFTNPFIHQEITVPMPLGEVLSRHHLKQLRSAETEKIAMVTYYFNGQREEPYPGEDWHFIDSPKLGTYDQKPQMATPELIDLFAKHFSTGIYDFGMINIACPDMVAHTGKMAETITAILATDQALSSLVDLAKSEDTYLVITADHGNAEELLKDGQTDTKHSNNPVPLIIYHPTDQDFRLKPGNLGDVAPTILDLLGIEPPPIMTCQSLISRR